MPRPVAHLANLDLNLLVALRELVRERSVTRAAQRLGVTQPAASAALSRLRRHFGDDLLVREHGEYVLTALGEQLAEQVEVVCAAAERLFAASTDFDPATSEREFTLVMADYTIMVMGEALSQALGAAAPRARLHIRLVRESMSTEYADTIRFVDGMVAPPTNGFTLPDTRSAELFRDRWVCLVDANNPALDAGTLRLRDMARLPWVAPYYRSNQRQPPSVPVMRQLALLDIQPRVAVRVESYLAVPYFVAGTDRVALMQERLATRLAAQADLKVLECPGDHEPIVEALWWHRQYEEDTAHAWLRRLIVETARRLLRVSPPRAARHYSVAVGGQAPASVLVGRDAELAVLDGLIQQTADGTGGAVVLAGEPGVGKTRLAREAAARADSVTVSWGACRESAGAPPLWPWIQVLRRLGETTAAVDAADGTVSWAGPDLGPAARFRLFERIGQVLLAAAGTAPHVVIIDDLHRADEASLRLLGYLSEALWPAPIGMIVAYRDTEVSPGSLAADVIAGLARGQASSRCELAGLSAGSVAQWLRAVGADGIDAADLHARTGGNPLFISESIRLLTDGSPRGAPAAPGTPLPLASVREVIRERLAPLPPACRDALEAASVLGRDFDYAPLAAALRISPADTVAALDPAVSARLVYPADSRAGTYRFVHALFRDAVEEQLAPSRRADLHARAFGALRDTGWGQASDLAHHAVHGRPGVSDSVAAAAARDAAEAADRLLAWEDAAAWWRTVIALTQRSAGVDPELEMRLGRSLLLAGRIEEARGCFESAAGEAARLGDGPSLAASALAVGDTVAEVAADHRLVALLERALRAPAVLPGVQARLTARWAIATYWQAGGQDESRRASLAAVELGERAGDTEALGAALIARQFTLRGPDFLSDRLAAGDAVLDIATRLGDDDLRFRAHQWLVPDRFQAGALGLVTGHVEQMSAIAEARRNPLQRWWVLVYRGLLASFAGRYSEAEALAHDAAALGRQLGQPAADAYRVGQLARVYWTAGRLAELESDIAEALVRFPGLVTLRCLHALADATAGRLSDATREIEALTADQFAALPRDSLYLASVAILGEATVTCRAADLARPILDELAPYAARNLIQGVPVGWGAAAWHIARLQWLLGRRAEAARSAAAAQRLHRQWGAAGLGHPLARLGGDGAAVRLSRRESEVLSLLAAGQANLEIAAALGVSVHTVERHVANIFRKLGVRNRAEATAWAHRHGVAG